MARTADPAWRGATRNLLLVAMALFAVTVIIGILNGLDVVTFDHNQVLTHVHAGTLGWITLGITAAAFWFFGRADRNLAWALGLGIPVYVAAFYTGSLPARAVTGVILMAIIVWLIAWVWRTWLANRSMPGLGVVLGLTTFLYGAVIGVLLQIQLATDTAIFPASGDVVGSHASAMVFSYLIPAAMGLIEWRVAGAQRLTLAGIIQYGALFAGGLVISVTLLFLPDATQPAGGLYLLLELVAVVIFAVRILPRALRTDWADASAARHVATSSIFVVAAMAIFLAVIAMVIANPEGDLPFNVIVASDHTAFVGVMTNLLLAIALVLGGRAQAGGAVEQLVFWGMNLGLVVFVVGLIAEVRLLIQIGAPVMGIAILLALAAVAARLASADADVSADVSASPTTS